MKRTVYLILGMMMLSFGQSFGQAPLGNPVASVSPDTLVGMVTGCGDSVTLPLTIYNTGSAPLFYSIQETSNFFDDFESGMDKWTTTGSWGISTNAYEGSGSLAESPSGNYGNYWDTYAYLNDSQIVYDVDSAAISFYMTYSTESCCDYIYSQISVNGGDWINLGYYSGNSGGWQLFTFGLSSYVQEGDYVHFRFYFHTDGSVISDGLYIDNFLFKGVSNQTPWISYTNGAGVVISGLSVTVNVTLHSAGMINGTHTGILVIGTNDPEHAQITVPVYFTVNGPADLGLDPININFDSLMMYTSVSDTIYVYNNGCATLVFDSIIVTASQFFMVDGPSNIPPFSHDYILMRFTPDSTGYFEAFVHVYSNGGSGDVMMTGYGTPAPSILIVPDSLSVELEYCTDSLSLPLTIFNTGSSDLIVNFLSNLSGGAMAPPSCTPPTTGNCCGMGIYNVQLNTLNHSSGDGSEGYQDYTSVAGTSLVAGETYTLSITTGTQYNEDVNAWLDYNNDGEFTTNELIMQTTGYQYHTASFTVPISGIVTYVPLRMRLASEYYNYNIGGPCSSVTYGQFEDYSVTILCGISLLGTPDTIIPGDSMTVSVKFLSTGLNSGNYASNLPVYSNDPLTPVSSIYAELTIIGYPEIRVNPDTLNLGTIMQYTTAFDSLYIYNDGCNTLEVYSPYITQAPFSLSFPGPVSDTFSILPGDSVLALVHFEPTVAGQFTEQLIIPNNDQQVIVPIYGEAYGAPDLEVVPDSLFAYQVNCNDTVILPLTVKNMGASDLEWMALPPGADYNLKFLYYEDVVDCGNLGAFPNQGTIEFWTYTNIWQSNNNCFCTSGIASNRRNTGFRFEENSSGNFVVVVGNDNQNASSWSITNPIPLNTWCHVAVSWDKIQNKLWINYNGSTIVDGVSHSYWPTQFHQVLIGVGYNSARYWKGKMDEVRMWTERRTEEQIIANMHRRLAGTEANLLAYWPMSEGSGNVLQDHSPNNHDGSFPGTTWEPSSLEFQSFWTMVPDSGTVPAGDSAQVAVIFHGAGLPSGIHQDDIVISSNDPLTSQETTHCVFEIEGAPFPVFSKDTVLFDTLMIGAYQIDSLLIVNVGCDSLFVSGLNTSTLSFQVEPDTFLLPAFSSQKLFVRFSPLVTGVIIDSIVIPTNIGNFSVYLEGAGTGAPSVTYDPDTLFVTLENCNDSIQTSINFSNTGTEILDLEVKQVGDFFDDFENGMGKWVTSGSWGITADAYEGVGAITESPNGNYWNYYSYWVAMKDSVVTYNEDSTNLSFHLKYNMECGYDNLYVQISVNNGSWSTITSYTCSSAWYYVSYPLAAYVNNGDYFKIRFNFTSDVSVVGDGCVIDNFRVTGVGNIKAWVDIPVLNLSIPVDSSASLSVYLNAIGLNSGTYYQDLMIYTNDPLHPQLQIPVYLTVLGLPVMEISDTVINFGSVMKYTNAYDTLFISNSGCDTLTVSQFAHSLSEFSTGLSQMNVLPGQTRELQLTFYPQTAGIFVDTLWIMNNDQTAYVILSGTGIGAPVRQVQPDSLFATLNCGDSVSLPFILKNIGDGDLHYHFSGNYALNEGLLAHYTFNGDLKDHSGNGRDLANYGATVDTGYMGLPDEAYHYSGADYMTYPDQNDIYDNFFNPHASVSLWAKIDAPATWPSSPVGLFNISGYWGDNEGIWVYADATNVGVSVNINNVEKKLTHPIILGEYFHLAFTYDGLEFRLYINDSLYQSISITGNITYSGSYPTLGIGKWVAVSGNDHYFVGDLDEIMIYNRGLSQEEVHDLYQNVGVIPNISFNPDTGLIIPTDSAVIQLTFNAAGLQEGIYQGSLVINTNDPLNPAAYLPASFEVIGDPGLYIGSDCLDFDSIMQFTTKIDSVYIQNVGCDTLWINQLTTGNPSFLVQDATFFIPPFGDGWVVVTFSPNAQGLIEDSLYIESNDGPAAVCLTGYCRAIPIISTDPDALNAVLSCNVQGVQPLVVTNAGLASLVFTLTKPANNPWLILPLGALSMGPGEADTLWIGFNRSGLSTGLYSTTISLNSNDPVNPVIGIPTYLLIPNPLIPVDLGRDTGYCVGGSLVLNAGGYSSYLWNTGDTSQYITITSPGVYAVSVTDYFGCPSSDTNVVSEFVYPTAYAGTDTVICSGLNLVLSGQAYNTVPPEPMEVQIGLGSSYESNTGPNPFGTWYCDHRSLMVYRKSELLGAGLRAGNISALAFNIGSVGWPPMNGFTIKMGTTSQNTLSGFNNTMTQVYAVSSFYPVSGWNTFMLDIPFFWNGTSNLLVEVCFDNASYSANSSYQYTSVNGTVWGSYCDNCGSGCALTGGAAYSQRPNLKIFGDGDMTRYSWSGPNGFASTLQSPLIAQVTPAASGTYTLLVNNGYGCNSTDTMNVNVIPSPLSSAGPDLTVLYADSIQLEGSSTGGIPPYIFSWTPAQGLNDPGILDPLASPASSTTYELTVTSGNGCFDIDNMLLTVIPRYPLSGQITYNNAYYSALGDVQVYLGTSTGTPLDTAVTDNAGNYLFPLVLNGDYQITAASDQNTGGINATDALQIARHITNLQPLSGIRLAGADVNASSSVTAGDALLVIHHTVGNISTFTAGDWVFESKAFSINGGAKAVDLFGLCYGDVNGSHVPGVKSQPTIELIRQGVMLVGHEQYVEVPISADRDLQLGAVSLELNFPDAILHLDDIISPLAGAAVRLGEGSISLAWQNQQSVMIKQGNPLLLLKFKRPGNVVNLSEISFTLSEGSELADAQARVLNGIKLNMPDLRIGENYTDGFYLGQNYPNPYNKATNIPYFLPETGKVTLEILNTLGEKLATLTNGSQEGGFHLFEANLGYLPDGIYFYRMAFNSQHQQNQMMRRMIISH